MTSAMTTPYKSVAHALVEPDAHGQAALLLTESLIHMLVESALLTNSQAVDLITTASEVKVEVAEAAHESKERMEESLDLLGKMAASFKVDLVQRDGRGLGGV